MKTSVLELQRTSSDCGVAAIRAVLKFFQIDASYKKIYKLAETSRINGTSSTNILKVLEYFGLSFEVIQTRGGNSAYTTLINNPHVGILCVDEFDHWVVRICTIDNMTVIFDPWSGTMILNRRQLLRRWPNSKKETYSIFIWKSACR